MDAGDSVTEAVQLARSSQVAIVCAGLVSSEGSDRPSLDLSPADNALIASVLSAQGLYIGIIQGTALHKG